MAGPSYIIEMQIIGSSKGGEGKGECALGVGRESRKGGKGEKGTQMSGLYREGLWERSPAPDREQATAATPYSR